jgi:hypothetical protein
MMAECYCRAEDDSPRLVRPAEGLDHGRVLKPPAFYGISKHSEAILMDIEKARQPHRSPHSNLTSSRGAPNDVERLKIFKSQPAGSTTNGSVGLVGGAPLQTLLDAVEDQCINLVNMLGIVHCMSASFTDAAEGVAPEISAAFDLLEHEIQRVVAGLKTASLRNPP